MGASTPPNVQLQDLPLHQVVADSGQALYAHHISQSCVLHAKKAAASHPQQPPPRHGNPWNWDAGNGGGGGYNIFYIYYIYYIYKQIYIYT